MPFALKSLVPFVHVGDLERSLTFYGRLGFKTVNTFIPEGQPHPVWAWLNANEANLMLSQAEEPIQPEAQGVLFYLYVEDITATHTDLAAQGIQAGPIQYPFYAPKGEFRIQDPDGYCVMMMHL